MSLLNTHRDRIATEYASDPTEYFKQYDEKNLKKRSQIAELEAQAVKSIIDQQNASARLEIDNKVENYRKSLQAEHDRISGAHTFDPATLTPLLATLTQRMDIGADDKK